jgi:hypothetical protein
VQVHWTDDLNPEDEATQTILFAINGDTRQLDVNDVHGKEFWEAIGPFWEAAHPASGDARPGKLNTQAARSSRKADIREWIRSGDSPFGPEAIKPKPAGGYQDFPKYILRAYDEYLATRSGAAAPPLAASPFTEDATGDNPADDDGGHDSDADEPTSRADVDVDLGTPAGESSDDGDNDELRPATAKTVVTTKTIREWAKTPGSGIRRKDLPDRGRVPAVIIKAYFAKHPDHTLL